jgi:CRP/FNR family transcriptional regulator, cyclic AMP receptor protein
MNSLQLQEVFRNLDAYVPFKPGQVIFKEGEFGDVMYVLMEGLVDVLVKDKSIGTFEPIEIMGEMAVIDAGPRSATVVAKTDCKLMAVNQKRFAFLIQQKPQFALHIMRILVERIRWMDHQAAGAHLQDVPQPSSSGEGSNDTPCESASVSDEAATEGTEPQTQNAPAV